MENKRKDIHAWIIYGVALIVVLFGLLTTPGCTKLPAPGVSVGHFEYDGHKYIQFGGGYSQSIVHDPNCPCHNNK